MLDVNFWKRFATNVNFMYYYAWWLFYTGWMLIVGSAMFTIVLIVQYAAVAEMQ